MPDIPRGSAARRLLAHWTILSGGDHSDGTAMTVPDDMADPLFALIELVSQDYGGALAEWSKDNPVLVEAVKDCRFETWHSCTKKWCENEGIDPDEWNGGWWAPSGDGARSIRVFYYDGNAYDLGEEAEQVEETANV